MTSLVDVVNGGRDGNEKRLPPIELASSRQHSGRQFQPVAEVDLGPFAAQAGKTLISRGQAQILVTELPGPYGIVDLGLISARFSPLRHRLSSPVEPLLNEVDAAIVAVTSPVHAMSLTDVSSRLPRFSETALRTRVEHLVDREVLSTTSTGSLRKRPGVVPLGHLHAVESKVRDWRRGLDQALRYSLWTHSSSVVVARLPKNMNRVVDLFRSRGVGLVLGEEWLVRPVRRQLSLDRHMWASEHFVAAIGLDPALLVHEEPQAAS